MRENYAAKQRPGTGMPLLLMTLLYLGLGLMARADASPAGQPNALLTITGHEFTEGVLHIKYEVRYTGMTKVRMYDDLGGLVWKGQYVNDKEGAWFVHLRMHMVPAGHYRFEFEYKGAVVNYEVQS